jgi:Rrf2 family transcriptional regulator, nitric oxide-sensitive transcriptional repressor
MFSQTAEYALRAVVFLASRPDVPRITPQIAEATHVPAGYLSKVLQTLGKEGIVRSRRGLHGGFTLAVPPEALTVLQVIAAVDPLKRIETCPLGLEIHGSRLCPLHRRLDEAIGRVESALAGFTIRDLLVDPAESVVLGMDVRCPGPAADPKTHAKA